MLAGDNVIKCNKQVIIDTLQMAVKYVLLLKKAITVTGFLNIPD